MPEDAQLDEATANAVYDILVEHCGASPASEAMRAFVDFESSQFVREYRFQGSLGFGGKFWNSGGRLYVNCYPEDQTEANLAKIAVANEALANLSKAPKSSA